MFTFKTPSLKSPVLPSVVRTVWYSPGTSWEAAVPRGQDGSGHDEDGPHVSTWNHAVLFLRFEMSPRSNSNAAPCGIMRRP